MSLITRIVEDATGFWFEGAGLSLLIALSVALMRYSWIMYRPPVYIENYSQARRSAAAWGFWACGLSLLGITLLTAHLIIHRLMNL